MAKTASEQTDHKTKLSGQPALRAGMIGFILLFGIVGFWAASTVISGAVIAQGAATVPGKPQQVQHLDGGMIAEIAVQNGDIVAPGDVLVRLDPTVVQLNHDIARKRLADVLAMKARLEAEQAGAQDITFASPDLPFAPLEMAGAQSSQRQIFAARAEVRAGEAAQLVETLSQYDSQISGLEGQIDALHEQVNWTDADLESVTALIDKGLARQSQLSELQQRRAALGGQQAAMGADLARLVTARRDAEITALQQTRSFHEEVVTELRQVTTQAEELTLDIVTRTAQLERIALRAPVGGVVHELQVATLGGVISPGATVLQIIPQSAALDFQLRVDPRSVDQVHVGQAAQVVLSSFDPNSAPRLNGTVRGLSPSAITDPQTGETYYRVDLDLPAAELDRMGEIDLMPGMPVEAYLQTSDRTVLNYLLAPLTSQLGRAFREG